MKAFISFLACLSFSLIAANADATITYLYCNFFAEKLAQGGFGSVDPNIGGLGGGFGESKKSFYGSTIPTSTTVNAGNPDYYSNNSINWFVNGGQTVFSFDTDHKRPGGVYDYATTTLDNFSFSVSSDEPYELSGYYNLTDVASNGNVWLSVELKDYSASDRTVIFNRQVSNNTINEQFVVGGAGGDSANVSLGSLTGTLIANHNYQLIYRINTWANPNADSGASALGNITFKIGNVPEPSTLLLLGIRAISLLGYRKAKSHG